MIARWLPAMVLVALAASSAWLLKQLDRIDIGGSGDLRHDPDFYMQDFVTVTMDETGGLDRELSAQQLRHYPDTDTNELVQPHMLVHDEVNGPWHVTADNGWISADHDVVLLQGQVHIWRDDKQGKRMEVITRDMRVLPDSQYAETDKPALIRTPAGESRSVGMRAFLDQNRLELLNQVRTRYEPKRPD